MPNGLSMPMIAGKMPAAMTAMQPPAGPANGLAAPNPFTPPKPKVQNGLVGATLDAFQRGLDPKGRQARLDQNKADDKEKATQLLALAQQQRGLPEAQRVQWAQQNAPTIAGIMGMDPASMPIDPAQFTDQALDGHIAALSGQLGMVAEPMTEYQKAQLAGQAAERNKPVALSPGDVYGRPTDEGGFDEIFTVPETGKNANLQRWVAEDGFVYSFDPQGGGVKPVLGPDGRPMKAKESSGVTINMPGSVREGIDPTTGKPAFVGINPGDTDFSVIPGAVPATTMMGAETKSKFLSLAPNAYAGLSTLRGLFGKEGDNPLSGLDDFSAGAANAIPLVGGFAARMIGGQNWQDFDQAWNAIELGVHIPSGAAVSPSEATRFIRANKPALGDNDATVKTKLDNIQRFYDGLDAGFRGDMSMLDGLMTEFRASQGGGQGAAGQSQAGLPPDLDDEEKAMIDQLKQMGKSDAEIQAILNGQ